MASVVGEASSSSPPSASIPPPRRSRTYHVFLSFRGEDTRNGITGHLHAALEGKGIKTFIDDKDLEAGEAISPKLVKAIEESMFAIIVFSPNYASSSWCLDELHEIVECSKKRGLSIVPVFYGVEPCHVRHQKGSFGGAFKTQESRFGQNSDKVRRWRDDLVQVANVSGFDFKDKHEATLVKSIADHIHKKLIPKLPSSTKNLVGIASRVEEVIRHIGTGSNDVHFLGIWGMGGIGKTTIARAVYEAIQGKFEASCFLANVTEACKQNRIVDKQNELVAQANISANKFYNEHEGRRVIQHSLCEKKVLLVLDDVSDEVQLRNLAAERDWFGLGSRIVITTRDIQLLNIYEEHGTYKVQGLVDSESFHLLRLKAFKHEDVDEKYFDLAKKLVKYSGGLPLALEVLGSSLCGKSIDIWRDAIGKIKSTPLTKIHNTLKISYDSLDVMEKNIFLYISCFFNGQEIDYVTELLEMCDYKARIGIDNLIDRSLVKINEERNVLEMHDLLQEMGRNIVIEESPNPDEQSMLRPFKQADLIFQNNKGSKAIRGIYGWLDGCWSADAFSNMTQLELLIMYSSDGLCDIDLSSLPTSLKVLDWKNYPSKTLWHGEKFLGKLKYLNLSHSEHLKQTPDLSEVPMLQKLVLKDCWGLTEVHSSVIHHKRLTLLDITLCRKLEALPGKLEMSSLNELILDGCESLKNLPEFGECMKSLSRLSLECTSIEKLPRSLGCLVGLKDLNLLGCENLECFPDITYGMLSLRTLNCRFCFLTEESFPPDFWHLPFLTDLDLSWCEFDSIPTNIHELPKLKCLKLNHWSNLRCLPELPSSIRELEVYNCKKLKISEFHNLSKVCGVFVSPNQDPSQVLLEMVISGSEIPSWFGHPQDGNSISIPCDYSLSERLGIVLCFRIMTIHTSGWNAKLKCALVVADGNNRFITNRNISYRYAEKKNIRLYIICLRNGYVGDGFHQGTCFELSILNKDAFSEVSVISVARCVTIEDIKNLKKSEIERPQKKHKKMFDLNISSEEMEQYISSEEMEQYTSSEEMEQ